MKKISRKIILIFCLLPILTFGQQSKWMVSFKTNVLNVEIEENLYNLSGVSTTNIQFFRPHNIHRKSVFQLGWNFGMSRRFKIMDNFYWLTGIELRYSRFEKQEWLEDYFEDVIYEPQYEIENIILDGTIDRELVDMKSTVLTFNPYPKDNPYKLKQSLVTLNFPLNFHFASNSEKILISGGFHVNTKINQNINSKKIPNFFEDPSLGVNLNFNIKFFKNWYISFSYLNFEKGVYLPSRNYLKSRNQNIFSFGLSCLLKP